MDAMSDAISDVDCAGAYCITVDELEHREQRNGALESQPDEGPTKVRSHGYESRFAFRRSRDHSTEVSSS
jgi:hypothetical protein